MWCFRSDSNQRRLVVADTEEQIGRVFSEYGTPLTVVPLFNYLGRTVSSSNNNWPEVEQNLRCSRGTWGRQVKILGREGADRRMAGRFYVVVVQSVLLFGPETWVMTPGWRRPLRVSTTGQYGRWWAWAPKRFTHPLGQI